MNKNPIVMVDDNSDEVFLAERCYEHSQRDNDFLSFTDAKEFLEYLSNVKSGQVSMPLVVLLDINMPVMSGFEVLASVREDSFFRVLPIVVITNSNDERDKKKSQELGATSFQLKPQSIHEYVALFDSLSFPP